MAKPTGDATQIAAVLGWPVGHSLSPAIHNAAFAAKNIDATFVAYAVTPDGLAEAVTRMRSTQHLGASITVPHKHAVMAYCDRLSDTAKRIGAVNCLVFESDGSITGHNTDAAGFRDSLLEKAPMKIAGKSITLLGAGGAARAVADSMQQAGANVRAIVRNPSKVDWIDCAAWQAKTLADWLSTTDVLVDCTSAALSVEWEAKVPCAVPLPTLPATAVVGSLVYHRVPALLREAQGLGLRTIDGASMLVHQGAHAFRLWTGQGAPVEVMRNALEEAMHR